MEMKSRIQDKFKVLYGADGDAVILRFLGCKYLVASMPLVTVQISRQDFLIRLVGIHCIVDRQIQSGMPGEDLGYCHDC